MRAHFPVVGYETPQLAINVATKRVEARQEIVEQGDVQADHLAAQKSDEANRLQNSAARLLRQPDYEPLVDQFLGRENVQKMQHMLCSTETFAGFAELVVGVI